MSRGSAEKLQKQEEARKNQYTSLITSTINKIPDDYTAKQKSDITTAEMGGIDAGYGNLRDEMMRRSSATGSFAGIPESFERGEPGGYPCEGRRGGQASRNFCERSCSARVTTGKRFSTCCGRDVVFKECSYARSEHVRHDPRCSWIGCRGFGRGLMPPLAFRRSGRAALKPSVRRHSTRECNETSWKYQRDPDVVDGYASEFRACP